LMEPYVVALAREPKIPTESGMTLTAIECAPVISDAQKNTLSAPRDALDAIALLRSTALMATETMLARDAGAMITRIVFMTTSLFASVEFASVKYA